MIEVKNRRIVLSSGDHGGSVPRLLCPYHKNRRSSSREEEVDVMVALFLSWRFFWDERFPGTKSFT